MDSSPELFLVHTRVIANHRAFAISAIAIAKGAKAHTAEGGERDALYNGGGEGRQEQQHEGGEEQYRQRGGRSQHGDEDGRAQAKSSLSKATGVGSVCSGRGRVATVTLVDALRLLAETEMGS